MTNVLSEAVIGEKGPRCAGCEFYDRAPLTHERLLNIETMGAPWKTRTEEDVLAELLEAIEQLLELEREELTS
jgi:hypothetical protein